MRGAGEPMALASGENWNSHREGPEGEYDMSASGKRVRADIDMRAFAKSAGSNLTVAAGSIIFNKGDAGACMYIVQSGTIEMMIGDKVIETIGPNEALGFMSMIDGAARSSTARAKEACELSQIDARTFRFMVDEVPNFASFIMGVLARRIRGMGQMM